MFHLLLEQSEKGEVVMTATRPPMVVHDDRELWHLSPGTKIRELYGPRREMTVGLTPNRLWHGEHPVPIHDIEMPVEVNP